MATGKLAEAHRVVCSIAWCANLVALSWQVSVVLESARVSLELLAKQLGDPIAQVTLSWWFALIEGKGETTGTPLNRRSKPPNNIGSVGLVGGLRMLLDGTCLSNNFAAVGYLFTAPAITSSREQRAEVREDMKICPISLSLSLSLLAGEASYCQNLCSFRSPWDAFPDGQIQGTEMDVSKFQGTDSLLLLPSPYAVYFRKRFERDER